MFFSFSTIIHWLLVYKYFVLFPIAVLEGPIITVIGGFLSSLGKLNFWLVYLVVVLGDMGGDVIYYFLGKWGNKAFISRWGHYVGITPKRIEMVERHFGRHTKKTLVFGKFTQTFGAPILLASGMVGINFWEYLAVNTLATLPKSMFFLLIGFYFGQAYEKINHYINYAAAIAVLLVIVIFAVYKLTAKVTNKYFGGQ